MSENRIEKHQEDYKKKAWEDYSIFELGMWVHLFHERSLHRNNGEKAHKDIYDAKNYLWMIEQKLKARAEELKIDYSSL